MALKLTVTSDQRLALGRGASIVLGVGGGSIGRAHDNDWVLPDPQCYVSAHHARIQFRHGTYYLIDTSTNGTYVNGGDERVNPRNIYPLRDGDSLRMGHYQIRVGIDAEDAEAPEASAIFPVGASAAAPPTAALDIGSSLDVRQLLTPSAGGAESSHSGPVDAFGQSVTGTHAAGQRAAGARAAGRAAGGTATAGAHAARTATAAAHARSPVAAGHAQAAAETMRGAAVSAHAERRGRSTAAADGALEALCRGAGLAVHRIPAEVRARLPYVAGLLLREALVGLKGLALALREWRDQAQLEAVRDDTQPVGLADLSVEELLLRLLLGHERGELDAVQWVRETAGSTRSHEQAVVRALPIALGEFSARLDPRALAHAGSAEDAAQPAVDPTGVTARFRSITETAVGALPQLFAEAFARAYAAELRGLREASRP